MALDAIRRLCLSLPGVTEDITWSAQPSAGLSAPIPKYDHVFRAEHLALRPGRRAPDYCCRN